jgi:hypothetical protein
VDCDSDHLPISVQFNWEWKPAVARRTRRWKDTDVEKLRLNVQTRLNEPQLTSDTPKALDDQAEQLIRTITSAIDKSTPWNNPSPKSVPGFSRECKDACNETQRLRRRWQFTRLEEDWRAYTKSRNAKGRLINKQLRQAHREKVTEAASTPMGLWRIAKWASNRQTTPTASITPPLYREDGSLATDPEEKASILRASFFPPPVDADVRDIANTEYPTPYCCPPIIEAEIERAVKRASPNKAPGPDGITNNILHKVLDLILPSLHRLFNASWEIGYFPQHFRQSITVVLRKPEKEDYSQPKAYRPIALLNTIGKALEAVIGTRLMYLADKYSLLPPTHIGGRKMKSTEHAIHLMLARIHRAWNEKQIASLLLLDVAGAFDNVSHPRLLHNLRKRRIDPKMVTWIASFISNRTTTLVLPEFTAATTEVQTGIPQGVVSEQHVTR